MIIRGWWVRGAGSGTTDQKLQASGYKMNMFCWRPNMYADEYNVNVTVVICVYQITTLDTLNILI